jgi:hypothetical protein
VKANTGWNVRDGAGTSADGGENADRDVKIISTSSSSEFVGGDVVFGDV